MRRGSSFGEYTLVRRKTRPKIIEPYQSIKKKTPASCFRWNKIVWVFCLFVFKLRMGLERWFIQWFRVCVVLLEIQFPESTLGSLQPLMTLVPGQLTTSSDLLKYSYGTPPPKNPTKINL